MRNFPINFVTFFFSSLVMEKFIYLSINVNDKNANANANKKTSSVHLQLNLDSSLRFWDEQKGLQHEPEATQTPFFCHESCSLIIMWHVAGTGSPPERFHQPELQQKL